jgi:hypothetical protein
MLEMHHSLGVAWWWYMQHPYSVNTDASVQEQLCEACPKALSPRRASYCRVIKLTSGTDRPGGPHNAVELALEEIDPAEFGGFLSFLLFYVSVPAGFSINCPAISLAEKIGQVPLRLVQRIGA